MAKKASAKKEAPAKKPAPTEEKTTTTTAVVKLPKKKKADVEKTFNELLHNAAASSKEIKRYDNTARGIKDKEEEED